MGNKKKENQELNWPSAFLLVFSKMLDGGFGAILVIGAIIAAVGWVFARQLHSSDALKFLMHVISLKGLGGIAILAAVLQPILCFRILLKARARDKGEIVRLRDIIEKYEKRIPLQGVLELESGNNKP
jgi:type II secretory pathway component PulF